MREEHDRQEEQPEDAEPEGDQEAGQGLAFAQQVLAELALHEQDCFKRDREHLEEQAEREVLAKPEVVVPTDAVHDPRAVVVELFHAPAADAAVLRAQRAVAVALRAVGVRGLRLWDAELLNLHPSRVASPSDEPRRVELHQN